MHLSNRNGVGPLSENLIDSVERIRDLARVGDEEFFDVLGIAKGEYEKIRKKEREFPLDAIQRFSDSFNISWADLFSKRLDLQRLKLQVRGNLSPTPERYLQFANSRIHSIDNIIGFAEKRLGIGAKRFLLKSVGLTEFSLLNPMDKVNILLVEDLVENLCRSYVPSLDILEKIGNKGIIKLLNTPIQKSICARANTVKDVYELVFLEFLSNWQKNYSYRIVHLNHDGLRVSGVPRQEMLEGFKKDRVGSQSVCGITAGIIGSVSSFIGIPASKVRHTRCIHQGDGVCDYLVEFSDANENYH